MEASPSPASSASLSEESSSSSAVGFVLVSSWSESGSSSIRSEDMLAIVIGWRYERAVVNEFSVCCNYEFVQYAENSEIRMKARFGTYEDLWSLQ